MSVFIISTDRREQVPAILYKQNNNRMNEKITAPEPEAPAQDISLLQIHESN
jgi:hypothetical protein